MSAMQLGQRWEISGAAPTSPPPFGRPAGHIGGTYDWWWFNFGRPAGMKYRPPTAVDMARVAAQHTGAMTPQERAVVPFAVPIGVGLIARLLGATWPAAIVIGGVAMSIAWFYGYQVTWSAPAAPPQ
jgi:hypothetical protein